MSLVPTKSTTHYQSQNIGISENIRKNKKKYLYETNVGAGLPLIDTIKLLHLSGENITRIKGVFSGTLSYVFNNFSLRNDKFSTIINEALEKGLQNRTREKIYQEMMLQENC
jgi:homoserine dehydrogenase